MTQDANFEYFLFHPNSTFNIGKTHKISGGKLSTLEVTSKKPHGRWKTPAPVPLGLNGTSSGLKQVKHFRERSLTVNGDDMLLKLSDPYPSQSVIFAKFCTLLKQMNNILNW